MLIEDDLMNKKMLRCQGLAFCLMAVSLSVSAFAEEGWMTDMEAAKSKAAEQKKDLLINFSGSDWCGWCIRLDEEVFAKDAFLKGVDDKLILVKIDYPQDTSKMAKATVEQNAQLKTIYPVQGFPTVLLTDAEGRPYAQTGYQAGGPEVYVKSLDELMANRVKRDEALARAEQLKGTEKAVALVTAINLIPEDFRGFYSNEIAQVEKLDPEDTTGFIAAAERKKAMAKMEADLQTLMRSGKTDEALALIDETIKELKLEGDEKQQVMTYKLYLGFSTPDADMNEALKLVNEIIAVSPESDHAKQMKTVVKQIEAEIVKQAASKEAAAAAPKEEAKAE